MLTDVTSPNIASLSPEVCNFRISAEPGVHFELGRRIVELLAQLALDHVLLLIVLVVVTLSPNFNGKTFCRYLDRLVSLSASSASVLPLKFRHGSVQLLHLLVWVRIKVIFNGCHQ